MKCIIVDDEPIARRGMKRLVERHPDVEIMAVLGSAEEALDFLDNNVVDLIFLDIQMPGLSGMELARRLPRKSMVVFTTAFSEYAIESYDVDALDYLVKPIDPSRFDHAIGKAREYMRLNEETSAGEEMPVVASKFLVIKSDRRYLRIKIEDIMIVEGLKDYVTLHLADRKITTRATVKGMEEMLPPEKFMRINKSIIVNVDAIDSFDTNDVVVGSVEMAIGQTYRDSILSRLLGPS